MILKSCNTCVISNPVTDISVRARVSHIDERITLHFDDNNDFGMRTDRLQVDFFDSQLGYIKTFCELEIRKNTDPYILEPWTADCVILEIIEILQRQKELRVRMVKEATFLTEKQGSFRGLIQNISVGGIYMTTSMPLEIGDIFSFRYRFLKNDLEINGKILRKTNIHNKSFGYGCQFVNMPKSAEREVRQYVYKRQLNSMR